MPNQEQRPARILMVDDNPTDVLVMRRAFVNSGLAHQLFVASDGQEAMDLLGAACKNSANDLPDLILLDLNMPIKDGFLVLSELKEDGNLRRIPVVVYSSSSYQEDVKRCYALQASSYISKPVNYQELIEIVRTIGSYWFGAVRLPN